MVETKKIFTGILTYDGAGVRLSRIFSNNTVKDTDPFLLLDHFGSDDPKDYIKGFPWHPHRGIETVTYMLKGEVEHADSIGNKGVIGPEDIQWMSAGSGIIHQEMPRGAKGMQGMQLWVNMPAEKKMSDPKYREIVNDQVPVIKFPGKTIKVISGEYEGKSGPVKDLPVEVIYLDIILERDNEFEISIKKDYNSFCYVIEGQGKFHDEILKKNQLLLFNGINILKVNPSESLRFLLVSGKPLNEPIAWGGPIVMNTREELSLAFKELDEGTFIKYKRP